MFLNPLDWMIEHYEPWLAKLGLIGEVRSSPLRRKPNARQLDAEHDKDLSGEQFGRGYTGLRPQENRPVRVRPLISLKLISDVRVSLVPRWADRGRLIRFSRERQAIKTSRHRTLT